MGVYVSIALGCNNEDVYVTTPECEKFERIFSDYIRDGAELFPDLWTGLYEKWDPDEFEDALKVASKVSPETVFFLDIRVEDDDPCITYVKDGKSVTYFPTITWPEFNEDDLE